MPHFARRLMHSTPALLLVSLLAASAAGLAAATATEQAEEAAPAAAAQAAAAAAEQESALRFQEVAPGIHAALQPAADRFNDCNVLVVIGSEAVLVVDAPARLRALQALVPGIRKLTDLPVRWVVNTHWHGDHTQGNAFLLEAFGPGVEVIGHESLTEDVPGRAAPQVRERAERMKEMIPRAEAQLARGRGLQDQELSPEQQIQQRQAIDQAAAWLAENGEVEFIAPSLTYATGMTLRLDPFIVALSHRPGHTRGDTVVWIPEARVLATGDLMDDLPYVGHGFPQAWVKSLETIAGLPFATVVPGHGPVFNGRQQFKKVLGFLQALLERAAEVKAAGGTLDSLQEAPGMDDWRTRFVGEGDAAAGRFFDGVLGEALERAWRDLDGDLDMDEDQG